MNLATPRVLSAVENLYFVFSVYPLPKWTDPCRHCHSEEDERRLHKAPLRALNGADLRGYMGDALLVWGDSLVFRHFLPRVLELFVNSEEPDLEFFLGPEMVLAKFRYADWLSWPSHEQDAVREFLHALWDAVLIESNEEYLDTESWLCAIAQAEDDLTLYLDDWIAGDSVAKCAVLSQFILSSAVMSGKKAGRNAFWKGRDTQYEQLKLWVRSPNVRTRLACSESQSLDTHLREQIQAAGAMLEMD